MPRRKSQPAKYYHCVNADQEYEIADNDDRDYPGGSDTSLSDQNYEDNCSPMSEDSTDKCRSDATLGTEDNHADFPPSEQRPLSSQDGNNSCADSAKGEDEDESSSSSSHSNFPETKFKVEERQDASGNGISSVSRQMNSTTSEMKSAMPRTLQEYVYRVIDMYYKQQFDSDNSDSTNEESKRPDSLLEECLDTKSSQKGNSLEDTMKAYTNGLKLVAELEQYQESIIAKSPLSLSGNSGFEKFGNMPSDLDQCGTCFKVLKRSSMREHMDRHNNTGRYRCEVCKKAFSKLSSKEKHELIHTDQRPFKCDKCEKAYRQKIHLVEHMRSHTGERPFVCPYCNYTLSSKSLLNRHIKTHEPAKLIENEALQNMKPEALRATPQKEEPSSKGSTQKRCIESLKLKLQSKYASVNKSNDLVNQPPSNAENVHRSDKVYKCDKCSSIFSSPRRLSSHMHNVHNRQAHSCPDCRKSFAHNSSLMKHRATEHGHRSLPLVNVVPITRKSEEDEIGSAQEKRNGGNSVIAAAHDDSDSVPSKLPRLASNCDNELNSPSCSEEIISDANLATSREILGSDL